MGELSAANATTDALNDWHPQHVMMLGIAGGIAQDDLDLGDVVVADQVIGYEYGKQLDDVLKPRDHVYPSSALLLERVRNFWSQTGRDTSMSNVPPAHTAPYQSVSSGQLRQATKSSPRKSFRHNCRRVGQN